MQDSHVVVLGASLGGVGALMRIASLLPPQLPAIVGVTLHIGAQHSLLPELLSRRGPNRAVHARQGERPKPGTIYVAPPDHHMLLEPDGIRLSRGPRENHARPAIDPMFRSAAIGWGSKAVGVVLTGELDDGVAGLAAIKKCGGIAIVQDPEEAEARSMPRSALDNVEVDHCLPIEQMVSLLVRLMSRAGVEARRPPRHLLLEHGASNGSGHMTDLSAIGQVSALTCPDCGGALWEISSDPPLRYRCHTGHAYTALSLDDAQASVLVLDLGMPDLDGREVARRVRAFPWGRQALLVAATGWGQEHDMRRSLDAGFDAHLTKPVHARQLLQLIAERRRSDA